MITQEVKDIICLGLQCPECFGVRVSSRLISKHHSISGSWECEDCGCNWDRNYYSKIEKA